MGKKAAKLRNRGFAALLAEVSLHHNVEVLFEVGSQVQPLLFQGRGKESSTRSLAHIGGRVFCLCADKGQGDGRPGCDEQYASALGRLSMTMSLLRKSPKAGPECKAQSRRAQPFRSQRRLLPEVTTQADIRRPDTR